MARDYSAAVAALNTLQTNFQVLEKFRQDGLQLNQQAIPEMIDWSRRVGYEPSEFNRLKPIHISGTKGKGSTSAFVSSILTQYQVSSRPLKVGLYTSPHLRSVRERIQINNEPISEPLFAQYFFEVWDRLEEAEKKMGPPKRLKERAKPVYFRYLTLMAFHTFLSEGVDTAVIECGIGGEYDSTNIIVSPAATAVTSLGIDHVHLLGGTIEEIAWHKSGIFKPGVLAFTSPQPEAAVGVLRKRADEKGIPLSVVQRHPQVETLKLGLAADFQKSNASLAVAVAGEYLRSTGIATVPSTEDLTTGSLPLGFQRGLETVKWPGRCEIRQDDPALSEIKWHIDGGHTLDSIGVAATWFASQVQEASSTDGGNSSASIPPRILLFNQQTRDPNTLLPALHTTLHAKLNTRSPFTHVIFTTNVTSHSGYKPDLASLNASATQVTELTVQKQLAEVWKQLDGTSEISIFPSIEAAVGKAREIAGKTEAKVLVTGSLHLVGGFLEVIESAGTQ
ncbi:FolC bifunctional protein [Eremomyces bilateralis CBS 781.70]|uniref:Folylpolyglutamate synthase n=1 Tax=Eremomyces bilateralis CBS 781.70 TaxID=1392243 RepID=A0A6G1GGA1_9PEZI|nr:FolC bifunctional protein [Eremomyces bilateralis CBS 781.70]KAF1817022.1 FolC bifunctional protein [Eremomyces bilateralis CBS 781.70]